MTSKENTFVHPEDPNHTNVDFSNEVSYVKGSVVCPELDKILPIDTYVCLERDKETSEVVYATVGMRKGEHPIPGVSYRADTVDEAYAKFIKNWIDGVYTEYLTIATLTS
jgi:hypothetical protein